MSFWSKKVEPPRTHTNAPRHWPPVQLDQFEVPAVNLLAVAAQLAKVHAPPHSAVALMHEFVYEDGILEVPILIEEAGHKTAVFVYSNRDGNAAAHYSGARALLKSRENASAVYYGPETLNPTKAAEVLKSIDTPMFSKLAAPPDNARFALWWATPEDPQFSQSPDRALLDRWFEALDGYGFLIFSAFVKDLDLAETKDTLHALPAQPLLEPLKGPGDAEVLLHASAQEGIFLAFDRTKTSVRTRRVLLTLLANFATHYRAAIDGKGIPPRPDERGLATWTDIREQALAKEAHGGADLTLHGVEIRDGQPSRIPCAQSAEERANKPKVPGREELDFAMDLIERVVARLKTRPVAQSSQEALGQPNLFPVIAVKADGHVWERQLPYEDAVQAMAAAGRALDEWPDAEIVAVLTDAAVRENGVRTDVLSVAMENRSGVAGDLIQRYRTSAAGGLELVGRPTATPAESFLGAPAARTEDAVDPGLAALGEQAVEEIVSTMIRRELGGMLVANPDTPLTSPSALVGHAESGPTLVRFMAQGPLTAAMACNAALGKEPADWVVFFVDDLVTKDGGPDRRLRLCVQRRTDRAAAIFDQHYDPPAAGRPLALRGELEFRRYGGSFFR